MTRKHVHLTIAAITVIATVIGCIVAFILFPPAAAVVAIVGGAVVGWFVNKSLDVMADNMVNETPPEHVLQQAINENLQQQVRTIHHHYSETDVAGHHRSDDIRETIIEDEPPPRPKKPALPM